MGARESLKFFGSLPLFLFPPLVPLHSVRILICIHVDIPSHMSNYWPHACKQQGLGHPLGLEKPIYVRSRGERIRKEVFEGPHGQGILRLKYSELNIEMGTK